MNLKNIVIFTLTLSMMGPAFQANAQTTTVESVMQKQIDACNKNTA